MQNVVGHKLFYDEKLIGPKLFSIPSLIGQQLFLIMIFSDKKKIKEQLEKAEYHCICTKNLLDKQTVASLDKDIDHHKLGAY